MILSPHNPIITTVIKNSHSVSLMKSCVCDYSQKALLKLESLCLNIAADAELLSHIFVLKKKKDPQRGKEFLLTNYRTKSALGDN